MKKNIVVPRGSQISIPSSDPKEKSERSVGTGKKIPSCPTYLKTYGKQAFAWAVEKLREMKMEDSADFRAVESLASAYEDFRVARDAIHGAGGSTYKTFTQTGELRYIKRPEVDIMSDAWKRVTSILPQLGMTLNARSKTKTNKPVEANDDPFAAFIGEN